LRADAGFERNQNLLRAIARRSTPDVQSLLVEGADPNVEQDGIPALTLAAYSGNGRIVELLLNAGADVNRAGKAGSTPLAAASDHADIVELLVKHGAKQTPSGSVASAQPPTAAATAGPATDQSADPASDGVAKAPLSEGVLQALLGCWRLENREEWSIQRTEQGGAQVTRTILDPAVRASKPDYVERARQPAAVMYTPAHNTYAFATAGPIHALLFTFTAGSDGLEGSWAASRSPGAKYEQLPGQVKLQRCSH
ncbi:MAG TPA: ankyrin repeat domain-containing protein, partial [Polyangiaceae bacterium]|nr:ankyrin repeat domain-containing protein [Polyangiaceae bacterium]